MSSLVSNSKCLGSAKPCIPRHYDSSSRLCNSCTRVLPFCFNQLFLSRNASSHFFIFLGILIIAGGGVLMQHSSPFSFSYLLPLLFLSYLLTFPYKKISLARESSLSSSYLPGENFEETGIGNGDTTKEQQHQHHTQSTKERNIGRWKKQ